MESEAEKELTEKIYYTTGEVAKMFNLSVSNIRFWESEFSVLKPKKSSRGDRFFTKKDIEYLKVIYHLVKEKGYTLDGAKKKLQQNPDDKIDRLALVQSLKSVRDFLAEIKTRLESKDP